MPAPSKRERQMCYARVLWPLMFAASLAACSGNLGGGESTLPGAPQGGNTNVQQVAPPAPTASPVSASNVATLGDSVATQPLPAIMGWSGTIAFPKPIAAPSPSPNPKSTPAVSTAPPAGPVSIGITAAVVEPSDAPRFSPRSSAKRADPAALKGLFFITLLSTADVTLGEYPKIAVDVPRDIAAKYRNDTFALALYDPETKGKAYRLAVAERDLASPVPVSSPTATPTPATLASAGPAGIPNSPITPPPVDSGLDIGSALPPEHIAFLGTVASLTLKANSPAVFALYVIPPQPSPTPSVSVSGRASPSQAPSASPATPSPSPTAS